MIPSPVPGNRIVVLKQPIGVTAGITPWNFPAAMVSRKIAPALAAGCTVVSRPADQTPLTMIQMFRAMADAGLPPGVANLVMGDARSYDFACALRAVTSTDGMTADYYPFPHEILGRAATRIINEVRGINRVVYDITSKPPGTIEWE